MLNLCQRVLNHKLRKEWMTEQVYSVVFEYYILCCIYISYDLYVILLVPTYPAIALKCNVTLSELSLWGCNLVDEAICELCGGLKPCKLKILDLRYNPFGEQGAKSLAVVIKINSTLKKLAMYGCDNISSLGIEYLMNAMTFNSTLNILTVPDKYRHTVLQNYRVRNDM